ncbi:MAG: DNA-binding protein HU [Myxococcota bacterium]|nr:DNA-binding protein HU [Myxococcota bacterium]
MTKAELIEAIQGAKGLPELSKKDINTLVDAVFDGVKKSLKKDKKFAYPGFGTFSIRSRKARTGRNPRTGEQIKIKASKSVGFKAAPALKESI